MSAAMRETASIPVAGDGNPLAPPPWAGARVSAATASIAIGGRIARMAEAGGGGLSLPAPPS
ncbi:MAG: hypothetical protein ACKO9Z_09215 [Planctomycetota bacterium]